ncbi:MAG: ArnT family glycosyltransferase [Phycisphaerae bacterium]
MFALGGILSVLRNRDRDGDPIEPHADAITRAMRWLWLIAIGFGALALLGGTMPPGILWPAEGGGYDVLEYHLGAPKDYFDAGRISYLPHNIYSNFPFNVEMLYLLSMILHGDPIGGIFTAKLLNVSLALLAVAAVWLAGREFGPASGLVAGLLAATCPFFVYLSGVAYVENSLVFFASMALAAMLRAIRDPERRARWMLASGLFAGLACGCKYTAVTAVAIPLFVAALIFSSRPRPIRPRLVWAFCGGCLIAFSPWLLKNILATGNPVFPLATDLFGAQPGVWNDDGAARWHEGHLPAPEDRPIGARFARLWDQVIGSRFYGPIIGLGIVIGGIATFMTIQSARRDKTTHMDTWGPAACWLMILIGGGAWLTLTHLVDRFAIVLVVRGAVGNGLESLEDDGPSVIGPDRTRGRGTMESQHRPWFLQREGYLLFEGRSVR